MNKKRKIITLISTLTISAAMIVALTATSNQGHSFVKSADSSYSLTLNGANAYTGSTSKTTKALSTDSGNYKVNFEYSGCSVSTNNHASISSSGYIRNSDHILSIVEFVANYSGSDLQIRTSYDGLSWGNYFDIKSGVPVSLSSKPYFIEMKPTSGNTTLTSAQYKYSCSENPDIPTGGYKQISSVDELQDGKKVIIFGNKNTTSGIGLNETTCSTYYLTGIEGTVTNNFLDNVVSKDYTIYTVTKSDSKYVFKSSTNKYLSSEVNGSHYNVKTSTTLNDAAKWSITNRTYNDGFDVLSGVNVYLKALLSDNKTAEFTGDSSTSTSYPINFYVENSGLPVDPVSISVSDSGTYNENSIYDGSKLNVLVNYSDGLSKKVTSGYTYEVTDSSGKVVPQGTKFGGVGNYTVTVTYGDFTNSCVIYAGIDLKLVSVEIEVSNVEYTTNNTIASMLETLTGDLHYNYSSEDIYDVSYETLSTSYGFSAQLKLDETSVSITGKFPSEGTYKVSITNGTITSNEISLTVTKAATTTWNLVTDDSSLKAGDVIVIGESSKGKTAGDITSQYMSAIGTTFSSDKISDLPEDTVQLTLGGQSGAWTLANNEGKLLGATAVKKLAWGSGTTTWSISISDGNATIQNGTSSYGRFLYNANSGQERFTSYSSDTSTSMILPQIYRGGTATPVYATDINLDKSSTNLTIGEEETLTVSYTPSNTNVKDIDWTTGNSDVAKVSNGKITAIGIGSTVITATYTKQDKTTISKTCSVEISGISVSSVSLDKTSITLKEGAQETLTETVLPTNASNKNVSWSTSDSSVATVANGTVTAVKEGSATITVTTQDGGKTATCTVTVKSSGGGSGTIEILDSHAPSVYGTDTVESVDGYNFYFNNVGNSYTAGYMQCKKSASYIANSSAIVGLMSISINTGDKSWGGTVYYGTAAKPLQNSVTEIGGTYSIPAGNSYFNIVTNSSTGYIKSITIEYSTTPVNPTAISIPSNEEVGLGSTLDLNVTYTPSNCNQNKGVSWTSSKPAVATVASTSDGKATVTPVSAGTTIITAKSTYNQSFTSSCTVTVTESALDKWTILMYVCGSNLESDYAAQNEGCATDDLKEIASVTGQPNDVNYVVQAGGANKWSSTYSSVINKNNANRFHLQNMSYVKDSQLTKANMGDQSTFESFLEWGLTTYPAENIGIIFWNHGGAMEGCCYDEQFSNDVLKPAEATAAIKSVRSKLGITKNFEFIGYDCCLMEVQDIASLNSQYANYQIASEESEWGYGWSYDKWVDDLFAKNSTPTILKACIDGYKEDTTAAYKQWGDPNDQTLSYLDLTKWSAYQTCWENMTSTLSGIITSSSSWTTFINVVNSSQKYGYDSGSSKYNNGYRFDVFDVGDFFNKMKSSSSYKSNTTLMNNITACQNAYSQLVAYEWHGSAAGNSTGLTMFCPIGGYNSYEDNWEYSSVSTLLTSWRSLCVKYGKWY